MLPSRQKGLLSWGLNFPITRGQQPSTALLAATAGAADCCILEIISGCHPVAEVMTQLELLQLAAADC